jgi:pyridoxine 5-phosphate synthase
MTKLSVNLNAVAMLRNRRDVGWPSVIGIARLVLQAGAAGITVHPRPDERHIRKSDVANLSELLKDFLQAEFNIEGYPSENFLSLVEKVKPHQVTFVPDDPEQLTSDHGWDIDANYDLLKNAIKRMKVLNIRTSLFIDEDPNLPPDAKEVGADRVELYTGPYGVTLPNSPDRQHHLQRLGITARAANAAGLEVNAGHDLTLENLPDFIKAVPNLAEVSIGHGITADALLMGFEEAVMQYKAVLS